jgi:hypothetical protein
MTTAMSEERDCDQQEHADQAASPVTIFADQLAFEALEPIFKFPALGAVGFIGHRQNLRKRCELHDSPGTN